MRLFLLLFQCFIIGQGSNILFANVWHSKSHGRTMMYLAESLVNRGHNVTMYSQVASPIGSMGKGVLALESQLADPAGITNPAIVEKLFWFGEMSPLLFEKPQEISYTFMKNLMNDENLQRVLLTPYDLVVVDEMFIAAQAAIAFKLKERFDSKMTMFSTTDLFPFSSHLRALSRNPATFPHSYVKGYNMFDYTPERFYVRLTNMIDVVAEHFIFHYLCDYWTKKAGNLLGVKTTIKDVYSESKLSFTDYPLRYGTAVPKSVDYVPIGEHCEPSSKLPEDLRTFVEDTRSNGTVYVAFGSIVNWSAGPPNVIDTFVKVFASLKEYRIIWSYSGPPLPKLSPNVKVLKWAPQNDILSHPKTVLFFTHGGLKSLREGICSNTPLLFLPFFADQCKNAAYAIQMQLAEAVYKKNITIEELGSKIRHALTNRQMKINVEKFHRHFTDNVINSMDLGVFWTEKVLRLGEMPHSKIKGRDLSWPQFLFSEIMIIIVVLLFTVC